MDKEYFMDSLNSRENQYLHLTVLTAFYNIGDRIDPRVFIEFQDMFRDKLWLEQVANILREELKIIYDK